MALTLKISDMKKNKMEEVGGFFIYYELQPPPVLKETMPAIKAVLKKYYKMARIYHKLRPILTEKNIGLSMRMDSNGDKNIYITPPGFESHSLLIEKGW